MTEKRRAEEALREAPARVATHLGLDARLHFLQGSGEPLPAVNRAFAESMSRGREVLEGASLFNLFPRPQAEAYWQDDQEVMAAGRPKISVVEPMQTPAGGRWVQTDKVPCRDDQGHVIGVIGFSVDITERKRAEEQVQQQVRELARPTTN